MQICQKGYIQRTRQRRTRELLSPVKPVERFLNRRLPRSISMSTIIVRLLAIMRTIRFHRVWESLGLSLLVTTVERHKHLKEEGTLSGIRIIFVIVPVGVHGIENISKGKTLLRTLGRILAIESLDAHGTDFVRNCS